MEASAIRQQLYELKKECGALYARALDLMKVQSTQEEGFGLMMQCTPLTEEIRKVEAVAGVDDPLQARGARYTRMDGEPEWITTFLFTSGSSGMPKAVVVGRKNFMNDVSEKNFSAQ